MLLKDELSNFLYENWNSYYRIIHKHKELFDYVNKFDGSTIQERCYLASRFELEESKQHIRLECVQCKNPFRKFFGNFKNGGYEKYCSRKCTTDYRKLSGFGKQIYQNNKKIFLEKYGVENPFINDGIINKIKTTNLERYGDTSARRSSHISDKIKTTNLERYGFESHLSNKCIQNKRIDTNLIKFGVENVFANKQIQDKIERTNLIKYGTSIPSESKQILDKISLARKQRFIENSWHIRIKELELIYDVELLTSKDEYLENKPLKWKHSCGLEYESTIGGSNDILRCASEKCKVVSSQQNEIYCYIKTLVDCRIILNDRTQIKPKEIDIWIPDYKLAIEFDGSYWHSNDSYDKVALCENLGINLLTINDKSWKLNKDKWKSLIVSKLQLNKKIYARSCEIREISIDEAREFLNQYHLQNYHGCFIRLGCFYKNELISVMTFGKSRFNKNIDYEMIRFCTKSNYSNIGGASKLLNYFIKLYDSKSIISYADRTHSNGNLYKKIGFKEIESDSLHYLYEKNGIQYSRMQTQKHKLESLLELFDETLSTRENLILNGFKPVKCLGSKTYVLENKS